MLGDVRKLTIIKVGSWKVRLAVNGEGKEGIDGVRVK